MLEKANKKKMKAVNPWRPLVDLTRREREMNRIMEAFFGRTMGPWWPGRWLLEINGGIIIPAVDVYEEKDEIVVKAELPGMDKKDIEIKISDSELTLKGEKKKGEEVDEKVYYRCERSYGTCFGSVDLPKDVQTDKVTASFKDGVLEVRIPKTEEAKTKEIKVKVE